MQLGDNSRSVACYVQSAWDLGGNAAMAPLFAALDTASRSGADAYSGQLSELSPGVAVAPAAQMQASMARFTGSMMSCPAFLGGDALTGEQDCMWGQVSGLSTDQDRSEEHTSELQSLMRSAYAVFCLKKKKTITTNKIQ